MKIDRLYGITLYLLNHKRASATELASEFEVSVRTIQRDIDALCLSKVPIISYLGIDGGYELQETYRMHTQLATEKDFQVMLTALKGFQSAFNEPEIRQTVEKFSALSKQQQTIVLDFGILDETETIHNLKKLIETAIQTKHIIRFEYTDSRGEKSKRVVEPIALLYKWYSWYVIGYDIQKRAYRMFKVVRLHNVEISEELSTFEHKALAEIIGDLDTSMNQNVITITFFAKATIRMKVLEYLNATILTTYKDGDFLASFVVPEHEQFWFSTILSFGSDIRVIEPSSLIKRIKNTCDEIRKLYANYDI